MIDITSVDLVKFVQKVYSLSVPQGFEMLHFTPCPLSDKEAKSLIRKTSSRIVLDMDYVKGRACKMIVFKNGNVLEISDSWYDHTDEQLQELLSSTGISLQKPILKEHGIACNCKDRKKGKYN